MEEIKIGNPIKVRAYAEEIIIEFDDQLETVFVPYTHGVGYQIEGLRSFELRTINGTTLFKYNARLYRCGPQEDENKIVTMGIDWTQQKAALYWRKSKEYVTKLFNPHGTYDKTNKNYWYHWKVLTEGVFDLIHLEKNECKMLNIKK